MNGQTNYKPFIIIGLGIVLVIVVFLFLTFSNILNRNNLPSNLTPSPSSIVQISPNLSQTQILVSPTTLPTIAPGDTRTGGVEEPIPSEVKALSDQKDDLRNRVPVQQKSFTVDLDYDDGKFAVTLKSPIDQSRVEFEAWRKTNYPAIPVDRFKF